MRVRLGRLKPPRERVVVPHATPDRAHPRGVHRVIPCTVTPGSTGRVAMFARVAWPTTTVLVGICIPVVVTASRVVGAVRKRTALVLMGIMLFESR
jgi:small neutral amino acid transporter SnatA (MarC family)